MMHIHVDDRLLAEMSAEDRVDRLCRILQTLEARDGPQFSFYEHERDHDLYTTR